MRFALGTLLIIGMTLSGCAQKIRCVETPRIKPLCDPKVERVLKMIEAGEMVGPLSPLETLALAECVRLWEAQK